MRVLHNSMAKKSIKRNYIYNVSYQILVLLTPLITTPYLSRVIGADGIGTVSYAESIVSYFTLFATLGITTFGQREISYVQESKDKRIQIFWEIKILEIITSAIVIVSYIPFALMQQNRSIYLILIFNLLAVMVDVTWFFQGMEEFGKIVFRNLIFKIVNIIYIFGIVKSKNDLNLYVFGIALFLFLSNASLWGYLPKYVEKVNWKELKPIRNLKAVLTLFVPTIAIQVYTALDKTMIGLITHSSFENGYYEQAIKISKMALMLVTSLGVVMIPRIGYHYRRDELETVRLYMYRGYRFVWFLGIPLCFGLIGIASNFVPWFYGDGFEKVIPLLCVLSFLILAIGINNVTGMQYLIPTKRQNLFTITVVVGACVNFILNSVLITLWQSVGAAIASVAAETSIAVIQLIIVRKELSFLKVLKEGTHYYIAGIIMLGVVYIMGNVLSPSIIHTGIMVLTGATVYFAALLILRDQFFISNIRAIVSKIFNRGGKNNV